MKNLPVRIQIPLANKDERWLTNALRKSPPVVFIIFASLTSFCSYTCIYAFRKTFAAATFNDVQLWGVDYKVWLVTFQVAGYASSKFIGIKIISEMHAASRMKNILVISAIAIGTWLGFAIIPPPVNLVFLFINGLVLGLAWGIVFGYLEGRRVTEVLGAALSVSFIFSAGLCRSAGAFAMDTWHVSDRWMPFVVASISAVPLLLFLYLLDQIPSPSREDEQLRTKRLPMNKHDRKKFITSFLPGIVLFVVAYILLTTFRDFRDNFSAEVWRELGVNSSSIYTATEIPVSIGVLVVMGFTMSIRNNLVAFMVNHVIIIVGLLSIFVSNWLFVHGMIDPTLWMTLTGLGLYLGYVPFNSIFFDRMIATFRITGTVGFIMYVADAFGYLGSISALFAKYFSSVNLEWLAFMIQSGNILSIVGTILVLGSMIYFHRKHRRSTISQEGLVTT